MKYQQVSTGLTQVGLSFNLQTKEDINIDIHLIAKEHLNTQNITTKIDAQVTQSFSFPSTQQEFPHNSFQFDIKKFEKKNDLTTYDQKNGIYPLIIKMCFQKQQDNSSIMYLYATFNETKENQLNFKLESKRIKIERNNKAYLANEIYGNANSKNETIEDKDCAICLCEKVDTMIIPCKHMCLCKACSQDLRFRAQKCPICRTTIERFIFVEKTQIKKLKEECKETDEEFKKQEELETQEQVQTITKPFQGKGVLIGSSDQ